METREIFIGKQAILLELEQAAEDERSLRDRVTLQKCSLSKPVTTCQIGKILNFKSNDPDQKLDEQKIFVGDIIIIGEKVHNYYSTHFSGFLTRIDSNELSILVHPGHVLPLRSSYVLQKEPDGASHRRLRAILNHLAYPNRPSGCDLDRIFLNEISIPLRRNPVEAIDFNNRKLNQAQRDAVKFALAQEKMAFIIGPPGAGKTTTIVEIFYQLRKENKRILVSAPSAAALDCILAKLDQDWYSGRHEVARLGHPGRTETNLIPLTLENIQRQMFGPDNHKPKEWTRMIAPPSDEERDRKLNIINERVTKLKEAFRVAGISSGRCPLVPRPTSISLKRYWGELLSKMLKVLRSRPMIFSTVIGAARDGPLAFLIDNDTNRQFDVLIIDESSQALEMASFIPMQMAKKVIIVGDLKGLPPTILSRTESSKELKRTLMQKCYESGLFKDFFVQLTTQYRMNTDIMQWPSTTFYENTLVADESIKHATLDQVSHLKKYPALILIDTKNAGMLESNPEDEFLWSNVHEAGIVVDYVDFLRKNGVKDSAIGIITPYKMQAKIIKNKLSSPNDRIVCDLEGLQGGEKEVIILSLVRSNDIGDVGLLDELQIINVAITRAKRHLAVVCDTNTIASHEVLEKLIFYLYGKARVIPAKELQENLEKLENHDTLKPSEPDAGDKSP